MEHKGKVPPSLEDYLETIYSIINGKGAARVTDVAVSLGLTKLSANKAVGILRENGYVEREKYNGLSLTEKGLEIALSAAGRHAVLTRFLRDVLSVDESDAEEDAREIGHHLSAATMERLKGYLEKQAAGQRAECSGQRPGI
ncbi:MAG: metal-dependent transcriptional regulator [Clostridiales bacterium]|nr:metal-dependent transcriptional regulator [Clostridiales bacterium]